MTRAGTARPTSPGTILDPSCPPTVPTGFPWPHRLASGGDGTAAAEASLDRNAGRVLEDPGVTVARGSETVTVTITGNATRIVPIFDAPIKATASGAVEHIEPLETGD